MIEFKTDINMPNPETGMTGLMLAAKHGYLNICNILIDAGADINAYDHTGNTALHLATQGYGEQIPVVETLIQRGANINAINEDGLTPAMLAKNSENTGVFKVLSSQPDELISPTVYVNQVERNVIPEEDSNGQQIFSLT